MLLPWFEDPDLHPEGEDLSLGTPDLHDPASVFDLKRGFEIIARRRRFFAKMRFTEFPFPVIGFHPAFS
jgi:hypothetical protein